jgi:hypothetical protein
MGGGEERNGEEWRCLAVLGDGGDGRLDEVPRSARWRHGRLVPRWGRRGRRVVRAQAAARTSL